MSSAAAFIDQWYGAIKSGDASALRAIVLPSVAVAWNGDPSEIPWAGRHVGVDAVMTFFGSVALHLEVVSVKVVDRFEAADATTIVLDGHWRVKANGREVRARSVNIFRFADGLIAGYDVYPDSGRFAAALKDS